MPSQTIVWPLGTTGSPSGPARGTAGAVADAAPVPTSLIAGARQVRGLHVVSPVSRYVVLVGPVSATRSLQLGPPSIETSIS